VPLNLTRMTDEEQNEPLLAFMSTVDIEALGLTVNQIQAAYNVGELNHLSDDEMRSIYDSAMQRDLQKTIVY
jgi:hypothetical protein